VAVRQCREGAPVTRAFMVRPFDEKAL